MKKIISAILSTLFLTVLIPSFNVSAGGEIYIKSFFKESFNTGSTNLKITVNSGNKLGIEDKPSEQDKSLFFNTFGTTAQTNANAEASIGAYGNIIFEFFICPETDYNDFRFSVRNTATVTKTLARLSGLKFTAANGEGETTVGKGVFTRISIALDIKTGLADYYVNKTLAAQDVQALDTSFFDVNSMIFDFYNVSGNIQNTSLGIDEISIYNSEKPGFIYEAEGKKVIYTDASTDVADDDTVAEYMKKAAALYAGQNRLYINGEVSDETQAPFFTNGTAYIPLDTAKKIYDGATSLPVYNMGGSFVSAEELCSAAKKKLTVIDDKLIVIGDRENFFDFKNDTGIYRTLCGKLILRDADGKTMSNYIKKNLKDVHPRLFMNSNDFDSLKTKIQTDEFLKARHQQMLEAGDAYTEKDSDGNYVHKLFVNKVAENSGEWSATESVFNKITQVGYCYRMTGDEKYAKRCIDEILGICSMSSWLAPSGSFLATSGLMLAAALCYDWMFDSEYMTAENKNIIKRAMETKGMDEILKDYEGTSSGRSYFWAQSPKPDNWNFVCNNAGLLSAMAFADVSSTRSVKIFDYGMKLLRKAAVLYAPDGAWYEGPGYWEYGTRHYIMIMQNLQKIFGDTYGFMDLPGIHETGYYAISQEGPKGSFNIGDANEGDWNGNANTAPALLFIASYYKDECLQSLTMNAMRDVTDLPINLASMYNIAYYDSELSGKTVNAKRDWYFRDSEIALMHKSLEDIQNDVFTALHAGKSDTPHGHLDAGQFVIDAYGTRFACDTGYESDSPNVKQKYYRYRTEGHNTIVINPDLSPGQKTNGISYIDRFESDGNSAIAVTDLTDMYENAESIKRGLKFTDNRSVITVQDEISLNEPSDIWWFMHSRQKITVADDGQSAVISGNKNMDMLVKLSSSVPGSFTVMDAMPMEDSLKTVSNNLKNDEFKKLALHFENTQNLTISVTMSFIPKGSADYGEDKTVTPIDSWMLDEIPQGLNIGTFNVTSKSYGFRADSEYTNSGSAESARIILAVYEGDKLADVKIGTADIATGGGNLSIRYVGKNEGRTAKVYLWDKNNELVPLKTDE